MRPAGAGRAKPLPECEVMQTLKVSVSLPDASHPDVELRLSADDAGCDVVITLPTAAHPAQVVQLRRAACAGASAADDDYVLGGYAGI